MLETKRTQCTALNSVDFSEILEMYLEPDSFKYVKPLKDKSVTFYRLFLEKKQSLNIPHPVFLTVRSKVDHAIIGTINLNTIPGTELIQIGCHLKRQHWNQGYATELMVKLREYAFEIRKLKTIYGVFQHDNAASEKLLKGLGFRFYEERLFDGTRVCFYQMTKEDYLKLD